MAGIEKAAVEEPLPGDAIEVVAPALRVRSKRAAYVRAFVPGDSEPAQIFERGFGIGCAATLRIEIFHTQDERAVGVASAGKGGPEGACVPDVQVAGGRRREAASVGRASQHVSKLARQRVRTFLHEMRLVLAEVSGAAGTHAAAARSSRGAGRHLGMGMARTAFGDCAGSATDQAMHGTTAGGAGLERGIGHLLALFEVRGAVVAEVLVSRHAFILEEREGRSSDAKHPATGSYRDVLPPQGRAGSF